MFRRLDELYKSDKFPWIIICFGIALRVVQYLHNRALFIDEARDTIAGILGRSFSEMLGPPPAIFIPSPPLGFFVIEKLAVQFMGDSEYVLRLFPLIAGIASLLLFYYVAKKYITAYAVPIALTLFATLEPLIYYSSSMRPYSSDVAFALLIFLIAFYIHSKKTSMLSIIILGVVGATAVWFSGPFCFCACRSGNKHGFIFLSEKGMVED